MKTKEELKNRIEEIKKILEEKDKMFKCYGLLEDKINNWKGYNEEIIEYHRLQNEFNFIEQAIKYIF
jgi:hypothetical protein